MDNNTCGLKEQWAVARPINGVTINGLEYLLDSNKENVLLFESKEQAVAFLKEHGITDSEIEALTFLIYNDAD